MKFSEYDKGRENQLLYGREVREWAVDAWEIVWDLESKVKPVGSPIDDASNDIIIFVRLNGKSSSCVAFFSHKEN